MRNKLFVWILLIGFWILSAVCFASSTEKYAFMKVPQGVKAAALGGSFAAIADDPSAVYWNPAGISQITSKEIYSSYASWIQGTNITNIIFTNDLNPHSFGASYYSLNYGIINETTSNEPQGTGRAFTPADNLFTLSYAYDTGSNLLLGLNLNILSQNLGATTSSWQSFDFGMLLNYKAYPGTSIGLVYKNMSQSSQLQGKLITGIAYKNTIKESGRPDSKSTISLDVDITKLSIPLYSYGIEYVYSGLIALRGGYNTRNQAGSGGNFSLGLGLLFSNFNFDLAFVPYQDLGNTYRVALDYKL